MRLLRDLWATSPRRTALVAVPHRARRRRAGRRRRRWPAPCWSTGRLPLFVVLAAALVAAVLSDLVGRPDHGRPDRRLGGRRPPPAVPGGASGRTCRRWRPPRSASCSTASTATSTRSRSELRGSGVRIAQSLAVGVAVDRHRARRLVAGRRRRCWCSPRCSRSACAKPTQRIAPARMGEEEAWSDLAAVMEESIHGQDDVRTSLARPYVLRLFAQRAAEVLRRGRRVLDAVGAGHRRRPPAMIRAGIARWSWSAAPGRWPPAGSTAPG